ncbi:MAG: preprotein translocase subunit SecG [Cyanobacteria bacterium P01_G01_bin.38]
MLTTVVQIVWVVAAAGLTILVLLHSPKGDGLGALGGQAQLFTSTKSAETTLNRATWTLTVLFMATTVVLSANLLEPPNAAQPTTAPVEIQTSPVAPADTAPAIPSDLPAAE